MIITRWMVFEQKEGINAETEAFCKWGDVIRKQLGIEDSGDLPCPSSVDLDKSQLLAASVPSYKNQE